MIQIHGKVQGGMFSNMAYLFRCLKEFEGKNVTVILKKKKITRTLPQNNYLWGVVYQLMADFTGDDQNGIHDAMGSEFLTERDDNGLKKVRSTTDLSTEEFSEYVEKVRMFAAKFLNLNIPDPE